MDRTSAHPPLPLTGFRPLFDAQGTTGALLWYGLQKAPTLTNLLPSSAACVPQNDQRGVAIMLRDEYCDT